MAVRQTETEINWEEKAFGGKVEKRDPPLKRIQTILRRVKQGELKKVLTSCMSLSEIEGEIHDYLPSGKMVEKRRGRIEADQGKRVLEILKSDSLRKRMREKLVISLRKLAESDQEREARVAYRSLVANNASGLRSAVKLWLGEGVVIYQYPYGHPNRSLIQKTYYFEEALLHAIDRTWFYAGGKESYQEDPIVRERVNKMIWVLKRKKR